MSEEVKEVADKLSERAITVDAWFSQPKHRPRKEGDVFIIEFHVSAEDWWNYFQSHPRNAHVKLTTWLAEDEESVRYEASKGGDQKPLKGAYGAFWQALFLAGFQNCPGVAEAIAEVLEGEDLSMNLKERSKVGLRRIFGVESLTSVSPEHAAAKFLGIQARTIIEQAKRKMEQKEAA